MSTELASLLRIGKTEPNQVIEVPIAALNPEALRNTTAQICWRLVSSDRKFK